MYYKDAFWNFIKIFFSCIAIILATIYISDPYMMFHKKLHHKHEIYSDLRVQNYGLIKYYEFDNIISGSSMLENTSAQEAHEKLGGTWVNLSYGGQRSFERFKTINWALKRHNLDNIIISLDSHSFIPNHTEKNFEPKLYDNSIIARWKIYMNSNAISCIFTGNSCGFRTFSLDNISDVWMKRKWNYQRFGGFDNWLKVADTNTQIKDAFKILLSEHKDCNDNEDYKQTIDNEIIPLFANNQSTIFHLIIPPYSALYWAYDIDSFDCKIKPYKYLIEQSKDYKNAKIYWMYDEDFVFDIVNYKDLTHYTDKINSLQLDFIKNGSHIINTSNYNNKFEQFRNRLKKFDAAFYINKIKEYNKKANKQ